MTDSHGQHLLVNPDGLRLWYLKYRFNRKESRIAYRSSARHSAENATPHGIAENKKKLPS